MSTRRGIDFRRHCEARSADLSAEAQRAKAEAVQSFTAAARDCFAALAMTEVFLPASLKS
jgi:hypothetical protein